MPRSLFIAGRGESKVLVAVSPRLLATLREGVAGALGGAFVGAVGKALGDVGKAPKPPVGACGALGAVGTCKLVGKPPAKLVPVVLDPWD